MRALAVFLASLLAGAAVGAFVARPPDEAPPSMLGAAWFPQEDEPLGPRGVPIAAELVLPLALAACTSEETCANLVGASRRDARLVPSAGTVSMELAFTWTARSAATQALDVRIVLCDEQCPARPPVVLAARGTSPLTLVVTEDVLHDPGILYARVSPADPVPGGPALYATPLAQDVRIAGTAWRAG